MGLRGRRAGCGGLPWWGDGGCPGRKSRPQRGRVGPWRTVKSKHFRNPSAAYARARGSLVAQAIRPVTCHHIRALSLPVSHQPLSGPTLRSASYPGAPLSSSASRHSPGRPVQCASRSTDDVTWRGPGRTRWVGWCLEGRQRGMRSRMEQHNFGNSMRQSRHALRMAACDAGDTWQAARGTHLRQDLPDELGVAHNACGRGEEQAAGRVGRTPGVLCGIAPRLGC